MNFKLILHKIEQLSVKTKSAYMLVGGFAVAYWGYPRQSLDLDIVLDLSADNLSTFLTRAKQLNFQYNKEEITTIVRIGNRFVMEYDDFRIDCWLPKKPFDHEALARKKRKLVLGKKINIISAEDLIISKLLIGRERDYEDIKTILLRQKDKLGMDYLNWQTAKYGSSEKLQNIRFAIWPIKNPATFYSPPKRS